MKRFARINVGAGMNFDANSVEIKKAIQDGIGDAWAAFEVKKTELATGKLTSGDLFGTRAYLKNNYLYRMTAAVLGIYGNSKEEAIYPTYYIDAENKPLDAAQNAYTVHFAAEQLPPVYAFWSLTMYDSPASLLVANPINRYLLNSPMLPTFKRDADDGLTFYIQNTSPGAEKEPNWLPAPAGPFRAYLRLYLPKEAALDGSWQPPKMVRVAG